MMGSPRTVFEPEDVRLLGRAYRKVRTRHSLACAISQLASEGERSPEMLAQYALGQLR